MHAPAPTLLDLMEGQRRRERGMALASAAQETSSPGFAEQAYAAIVTLARTQEFIFVDDLLGMVAEPEHYNAWGAVWARAQRRGVIERTAQTRISTQPKKQGHRYFLYRSKIYQPA